MRTPIIAGNWKLHMNPDQTVEFVKAVKDNLPATDKVEALICAPSVDLDALARTAQGSNLRIGAENAYFENEGAFTGETSPKVLKDMGMNYCIIGHSERRGYFHETDEDINKKAKSLFAEGITPVICCGESLEKREANQQEEWVIGQIKAALQGLSAEQVSQTVIAYEPIWAIGTGKTATSDQAEEMCKTIRNTVKDFYNEETAENVRIQYGGSVNPDNVRELMAKPDIDGGLVGGASLKPDSFLALVNYQD